jgi:hypothetical protein
LAADGRTRVRDCVRAFATAAAASFADSFGGIGSLIQTRRADMEALAKSQPFSAVLFCGMLRTTKQT